MFTPTSGPQATPDCGVGVTAGDPVRSDRGGGGDDGTRVISTDGGVDDGPYTVRREDRAWLRRRTDDLNAAGWRTLDDEGDRVVLRKRGFGRLPIHGIVFLLTGGIGNLLYAIYSLTVGAPRRTVHADGTEERVNHGPSVDFLTVAGVAAALFALLAAVVWVAVAALVGLSTAALVTGALLFALTSLAMVLAPTVIRTGVEPVTTFGRRKALERERVRNPPEPCAACGTRIFHGERRGYAERRYVAGIPVGTTASGENTYCAACADEVSGPFTHHEIEAELDRMRTERDYDRRTGAAIGPSERERELESELQ